MLVGALVVACAASACDDDELEGERAPTCTAQSGCPEGFECVDGLFCERIPGTEEPDVPTSTEPRPPPTSGTSGGDGQGDRDAAVDLDAGDLVGVDGGILVPPAEECTLGLSRCGEQCVSLESDVTNCGACGVVCLSGGECRVGVCCNLDEVVCGDRCVDVETDPRHCGACGVDCGAGDCVLGTCQPPIEGPGLPPGNPPFGG
ncbi:Hypothetical protein I5071_54330 [Sandaracinus amylolyticus]|nr:Hypothetical protein I5071_54330 [Sandaracinus amylolyticus]